MIAVAVVLALSSTQHDFGLDAADRGSDACAREVGEDLGPHNPRQ